MSEADIRWLQRFDNFTRALQQLSAAVDLAAQRPLSVLEQQGLIQAFEYTHELAWQTIKDYFVYQGNTAITGSRDATRAAFAAQLITDGEIWMDMIKSRNKTVHTYNQAVSEDIARRIIEHYHHAFRQFFDRMKVLQDN